MGKSTKRGILPTNAGRKYDGIDSNGKLWGNGGAAISTSTASTQRSVIYNGVSAKTGELFVVSQQ